MVSWEECTLFCRRMAPLFWVFLAAAQTRPLALQQTRFAVRMGEPAAITASGDTLDFLHTAQTRRIEIAGAPAEGLIVAPDRAGNMVLAASMRAKPGEYAA